MEIVSEVLPGLVVALLCLTQIRQWAQTRELMDAFAEQQQQIDEINQALGLKRARRNLGYGDG